MDLLTSLLSSLLAAWLAVTFHLRNHRSVQSWNEKFKAYSEVIKHLGNSIHHARSVEADAAEKGSSVSKNGRTAYEQAVLTLAQISRMQGWLMAPQVAVILRENVPDLRRSLDEALEPHVEATRDVFHMIAEVRESQIKRIIEIAGDDLGFHRPPWWRKYWRRAEEKLGFAWYLEPTTEYRHEHQ